MKYKIPYKNLDLFHTLSSGQTFEWYQNSKNDEWHGTIYGNPLVLKQSGDKKSGSLEYDFLDGINREEDINKYFGLDEDYEDLINKISFDKYINTTLEKLYGLRVIRQDPWFCINSFILSSNNTVKNIQAILRKISLRSDTNQEQNIHFNFPSFEIANTLTEQDLRECKAGFRAKYLRDFYNKLQTESNFISSLYNLDYDNAKLKLMEIKGIGEKVADCILLYAFNKYDAYPIDTHLRKATLECYFGDIEKKPSDKEMRIWAKDYWKGLAGFAHFFLFTYHRMYGEIKI